MHANLEMPPQRTFLLLAASGSGKSTLANEMVGRSDGALTSLNFGDFLQAEAKVSRSVMRANADTLLTPEVVGRATAAIQRAAAAVTVPRLIIECRNVAVRDYGLLVSTYARDLMRGVPAAGVLYLDVNEEELGRRTASDSEARPWRRGIGAPLLGWERISAALVASSLEVPLHVLDGDRPMDETAETALRLVSL